ncbi:hypothetical protein Tco_0643866 [Tanacetum coccineum]
MGFTKRVQRSCISFPKISHAYLTNGATRQTCLGAEVRMRTEHILREKKKLEARCSRQADLLKERDVEITSLRAQLTLNEAEALEAICLFGQVFVAEATEAARVAELNSLKEQTAALEGLVMDLESMAAIKDTELASSNAQITKLTQDFSYIQLSCDEVSIKAVALESEKDKLTDQVSMLETTCSGLRDQVLGYELFKEQYAAVQDEQVKILSDKVVELDSDLMGMALYLNEEFNPCFFTTIAGWSRAIDKGMQDGLVAGIDHGMAERGLVDVATYNPSTEANYVSAVNALRAMDFPLLAQLESQKDASMADIMGLLHLEGLVAEALETIQIKGDAALHHLSLYDVMVPLIEPLFAGNLVGEASTSGHVEVPSSTAIVFEKEELETTPERPKTS